MEYTSSYVAELEDSEIASPVGLHPCSNPFLDQGFFF